MCYNQVKVVLSIIFNKKIMLWTIIIVLFALWLLGFSFKIGGKLVHTLIVIALILFILRLLHIF